MNFRCARKEPAPGTVREHTHKDVLHTLEQHTQDTMLLLQPMSVLQHYSCVLFLHTCPVSHFTPPSNIILACLSTPTTLVQFLTLSFPFSVFDLHPILSFPSPFLSFLSSSPTPPPTPTLPTSTLTPNTLSPHLSSPPLSPSTPHPPPPSEAIF